MAEVLLMSHFPAFPAVVFAVLAILLGVPLISATLAVGFLVWEYGFAHLLRVPRLVASGAFGFQVDAPGSTVVGESAPRAHVASICPSRVSIAALPSFRPLRSVAALAPPRLALRICSLAAIDPSQKLIALSLALCPREHRCHELEHFGLLLLLVPCHLSTGCTVMTFRELTGTVENCRRYIEAELAGCDDASGFADIAAAISVPGVLLAPRNRFQLDSAV